MVGEAWERRLLRHFSSYLDKCLKSICFSFSPYLVQTLNISLLLQQHTLSPFGLNLLLLILLLLVKVKVKSLSRVRLFVTPWTVACQAPPSMRFSRQEYWSGLPFPSPGDLPNPGIKPMSPALQADALTSEPPGKPSYSR